MFFEAKGEVSAAVKTVLGELVVDCLKTLLKKNPCFLFSQCHYASYRFSLSDAKISNGLFSSSLAGSLTS